MINVRAADDPNEVATDFALNTVVFENVEALRRIEPYTKDSRVALSSPRDDGQELHV